MLIAILARGSVCAEHYHAVRLCSSCGFNLAVRFLHNVVIDGSRCACSHHMMRLRGLLALLACRRRASRQLSGRRVANHQQQHRLLVRQLAAHTAGGELANCRRGRRPRPRARRRPEGRQRRDVKLRLDRVRGLVLAGDVHVVVLT
eukprot:7162331-Pyramimonas_sp.AAC.2